MRLRATIACLAVGVFPLPATADIIYDNLAGAISSWSVPAGQPEADWETGVPFPVEGLDYFLDSIDVMLNAFVGYSGYSGIFGTVTYLHPR